MLPGWIDSHVHFLGWALDRAGLDLRDARTVEEALDRIVLHQRGLPAGRWITQAASTRTAGAAGRRPSSSIG